MSARQVLALGGAAIGALAALNSALSSPPKAPKPQTPGRAARFPWSEGAIHYTVEGEGTPLLLVHGLGVAASSFEMRYVAEPLARAFRVYALDLLGFGLSERPRIDYSAALYTRLLADFLREIVRGPTAIIACGASGSFAVRVAARQPDLVRALMLSSPAAPGGGALPGPWPEIAGTVLATPILGQSVFNLMTARNGIRAYLRDRAYHNPDLVTESMVDAQYAIARQPNARLAAQAYLAGKLDLDITADLPALRQPLLVAFGAQAVPPPHATAAAYARLAPNAQVLFVERSGSLPHEEQAERFASAARAWLTVGLS